MNTGIGLGATALRTEFRENPLGIDVRPPRLAWKLAMGRPDSGQSAYQILVASSSQHLAADRGDLWDSGQIESANSIGIDYAGQPLQSRQRAHWKVRVWDRSGIASEYSQPAWWEMGLLDPADWHATWIRMDRAAPQREEDFYTDRPAPLLRKEFQIDKPVMRARAYVSGLGYYELSLNGSRVGDHMLDPGWTSYSKRVLYSTYDITHQLKQGRNAIGAILGNGWYNPLPMKLWGYLNMRESLTLGEPRLICQLYLEFEDGSSQTILSDETWKAAEGPILRNNIYLGEVYDARLELAGWDIPGFDDSDWHSAVAATEPLGPLRAQQAPPIRITRTIEPINLTEPTRGVYLFDLGENFAGWIILRVKGLAGTRITLRYGELRYPDGSLNAMTAVAGQIKDGGIDYRYDGIGQPKTAFPQDVYILKGGDEEQYTPRFTFRGFRYVEVSGLGQRPTLDMITGLRLNSDVEPFGSFECSNPLFNRIQDITLRTELSNLFSVQSDCPHRERLGYGGDISATSEMAMLNFDMSRFYAKAVEDLGDAAGVRGEMPFTAPFVGIKAENLGGIAGPIGWGTAHPLLQTQLYQYYGDCRLLTEQYTATRRWVESIRSTAKSHIIVDDLGDHESLVPWSHELTGTAFYYWNVTLLSRIARIIGQTNDAQQYESLAADITQAFNAKFLDPRTGQYDTGTQASQAIPLYLGLVPETQVAKALDVLERDVLEKHNGHLSTGMFGTKFMLDVLSRHGKFDLAYTIVNQKTFPGWGHMIESGATSVWEHWEYSDNVYSHNHPMFGCVGEWFIKWLAGIQPASDAVGFDKILVAPHAAGDLTSAEAIYKSIRGTVRSSWKLSDNNQTFELDITIPPNASAVVRVPINSPADSIECGAAGGEPAHRPRHISTEPRAAVYRVGSGDYHFKRQPQTM